MSDHQPHARSGFWNWAGMWVTRKSRENLTWSSYGATVGAISYKKINPAITSWYPHIDAAKLPLDVFTGKEFPGVYGKERSQCRDL